MRKIPANGGTQCREIQFPDSQEETRESASSNEMGASTKVQYLAT